MKLEVKRKCENYKGKKTEVMGVDKQIFDGREEGWNLQPSGSGYDKHKTRIGLLIRGYYATYCQSLFYWYRGEHRVLWPREPVVKRGEAEFNNSLEGLQNSMFFEVPINKCFVI